MLAVGAVICLDLVPLAQARTGCARMPVAARAPGPLRGVATLPLAALGFAAQWGWSAATHDSFPMPLGPRPLFYVGLMATIGLLSSWLGT